MSLWGSMVTRLRPRRCWTRQWSHPPATTPAAAKPRPEGALTVLVGPDELRRAGRPVPRRGEAQHRREVGRELPQVGYVPVVHSVEIWGDGDDRDGLGDVGGPRQELGQNGDGGILSGACLEICIRILFCN